LHASLLNDGQGDAQCLCEVAGAFRGANVGGNNHCIRDFFGPKVVTEYVKGGQFVHRDAEETLDLTGM
jgi:hypothetical protein